MLKRYFIITLLLFAYTIVLAHSIIPHHHDDDRQHEQSSANHDDHGDDNDGDSALAHAFGHYFHSGSTADLHHQPEIKISCNTITTVYIVASFDFKIKSIEISAPIVGYFKDHIPLTQHYLCSKGLRAPPSDLV